MRRSVLFGAVVWALVVAASSAVTWAVISSAGQQVLTDTSAVSGTTASRVGRSLMSLAHAPAATLSARPTHRLSPTPSPSARPSPTAVPVPPATRSATPSTRRVWQGDQGTVVARCSGGDVTLQSATPNNGYRVQVNPGAGRLAVLFEPLDRPGPGTRVDATCVSGTVRFGEATFHRDD